MKCQWHVKPTRVWTSRHKNSCRFITNLENVFLSSNIDAGVVKVKSTERTWDREMTLETQIKNNETGSIINSITAQSNENIHDTLPYL